MSPIKSVVFIFAVLISNAQISLGQAKPSVNATVRIDEKGVMRYGKSGKEVQGFGVNYTAPFAHGFRVAKQLNIDLEKAIENDVYHFARLGFDAYRVHVWDTEISDSVGNLLNNEHLQLFDFMLSKMKERGIKQMITPIAYWGNGWPQPDEKTPGFSAKYGKAECLVNPDAIKAQENYLYQFLNHINPYTRLAYKDDPDIIGFEISNEPHHREALEKVTEFISRMVNSMRNTGCQKPVFYNISHSIHLVDAYYNASINGGTFQWYPTGLGFGKELEGNFLPNVDKYVIPFAANEKFKKGAKLVYEFDAADIGRSYIYPAMARSFREAGIQWATHFAYDPTYMAFANTEYNTHYMNLVYAPQKALSLKIASEVFHNIPMYKSFGSYPSNTSFDAFKVDYEKDLAEMVSDKKFIYTNNTGTIPPSAGKLEEIAGFGNSSLVKYEGEGAYFLDKIETGIWRLEVLPDAIWVKDPFGKNSLEKVLTIINWRKWPMSVNVPDLGKNYSVVPLNQGNDANVSVNGATFNISPGTYLLVKNGVKNKYKGAENWKNIKLNEFTAPATTLDKAYVLHKPAIEIPASEDYSIVATVVTKEPADSVFATITTSDYRRKIVPLKKLSGYQYGGTVSAEMIKEGFLDYYITIKDQNRFFTYPSGAQGQVWNWDFYQNETYKVPIRKKDSPIYLFDATRDSEHLMKEWKRGSSLIPSEKPGEAIFIADVDKLFTPDPENTKAEEISDYSLKYCFKSKIANRINNLKSKEKLVIKAASMMGKPIKIQIALITKDAMAFGKVIEIGGKCEEYSIPVSELLPVKMVTLPRPYPSFLPYYFQDQRSDKLDMKSIESLQISIGPGLDEEEKKGSFKLAIEEVYLK